MLGSPCSISWMSDRRPVLGCAASQNHAPMDMMEGLLPGRCTAIKDDDKDTET